MVELPSNGSIVAIWVNNSYDLKVDGDNSGRTMIVLPDGSPIIVRRHR